MSEEVLDFIRETTKTDVATEKRPYIPPGTHEFEIERVFFLKSKNPKKKNTIFFTAYFTVVSSSNPDAVVGSEMCMIIDTSHIMASQSFKSFLSGALGIEPSKLTEDQMQAATGDDNPLKGEHVKCIAVTAQSKAGKPFVKLAWRKL